MLDIHSLPKRPSLSQKHMAGFSLLFFIVSVLFLVVGFVAGFYWAAQSAGGADLMASPKKPLYWVAPMDSDYRRDAPGKSPMGMDLIPFFDEPEGLSEAGPGSISVSPNVVNSLGVRTSIVEHDFFDSSIKTVGYVKYDEEQFIHVHPRVSGWVEKLYKKAVGDPVEKGEPLYSLYSPELVGAQEDLRLALVRGDEQFIQAAVNRLQALHIPDSFIDKLKRTLSVQHSVTFYAPQGGAVDHLTIREGFYVQPGTTILSIGSLNQVWVEAEVFERQAALVAVGSEVAMTSGYVPGRVWRGRVDYVYPELDSKTRTLRVRLKFKNMDHVLKPNMFTQVVITPPEAKKAVIMVKEALIRTGSQDRVVLALGEGRYKSISVKVGRVGGSVVEILSGLVVGDRVVSSGQFLLDSESSKTSDFMRLNSEKTPKTVWVNAEVMSVGRGLVSVRHEAILEWRRPTMTMDLLVNGDVDMSALELGVTLSIEVRESEGGQLEIIDIEPRSAARSAESMNEGAL